MNLMPSSSIKHLCPRFSPSWGFFSDFASRKCMADGQWYVHPGLNTTWSDYSNCYDIQPSANTPKVGSVLEAATSKIRLMYNIGYGISLVSLSVAVFIMIYFKRLHCPRNTVHLNLFIAFILRATLSTLKENLLVHGLGLPSDVERTPIGTVIFIEKGLHWECKTLFVCFYYVLSCSYMWIFVEGLHLHVLIMVSVFSERSSVKWYIAIGWGVPVLFIIPWAIVRALYEDTLRFAKATLVLIPLFGVQYVVFIGFPDNLEPEVEVVKLYFEMFFNSFQGLLVAVLFCFLNGEHGTDMHVSGTKPSSVTLSLNNVIWPKGMKIIMSKNVPKVVGEWVGYDATGPTF
ncbi:hypothetical protein FSP39_022000 [Pinctada imbricata]|uniref:Uncharacterized protein n=1 Tax=Pinctada imbricata TaxID=66713 RepID=A0AA88YP64_PINIB|nr:hypothetical protein FSP39_022000 [Pinctada imbricata]